VKPLSTVASPSFLAYLSYAPSSLSETANGSASTSSPNPSLSISSNRVYRLFS